VDIADALDMSTDDAAVLVGFAGKAGDAAPTTFDLKSIMEFVKTTLFDKTIQGLFDRYYAFARNEAEAARKGITEEGAAPISYWLSRLSSTGPNAVKALFEHGPLALLSNGTIAAADKKGKKLYLNQGLSKYLDALGGEMRQFFFWVIANRADMLMAEGRENLFTEDEIRVGLKLNQGKLDKPVKIKVGKEEHTFTTRAELYDFVNDKMNEFRRSVLDVAIDSGIINDENRAEWDTNFYMPFYRVLVENANPRGPEQIDQLIKQFGFKRLMGGTSKLGDPLQNMIMNFNHLVEASLKNNAGVKALELAEKLGLAEEVDGPGGPNVIWVMKQGERVHYRVDDALTLASLESLNQEGMNGMTMKTLRKFKRALTYGVTTNPAFMARNLIRDSVMALALPGTSYNPLRNIGNGLKYSDQLDNDAAWQKLIEAMSKQKGKYMAFGNRLENVNRIGSAVNILERAMGEHLMDPEGKYDEQKLFDAFEEAGLEAAFKSRDMMDYSLIGSWKAIRILAGSVSFFNARLQGLYKGGREVKPAFSEMMKALKAGKMPDPEAAKFIYVSTAYTMASLLLYLWFKGDDRYRELEEWDKETYHHFWMGDQHFKIPRPFEMGAWASIGERALAYWIDDEMDAELFLLRLKNIASDQLNLGFVPQAFVPAFEIYANRDSFTDRPIESISMQRRLQDDRKHPWTTTTGTLVAKVSPWHSPVEIDHLVEGYFGWLGATGLHFMEMGWNTVYDTPHDPGAYNASEWPVVGSVIGSFWKGNMPPSSTKYTTQFYEQLKQSNQVYETIRHYRRLGDNERAIRVAQEKGDQLAKRKASNAVQKQLSAVNRRVKQIFADPMMSPDVKRAELHRLTVLKNRLTKTIMQSK
jgi:hypothetical protein